MPFHFKALILVFVITVAAFAVAKPVFVRFMDEDVFIRRRNLWLALTLAAFLIPNFWLFMLVAAALMLAAAVKDPNPAALYMFLLLVLPPLREELPTLGVINQIFGLDHLRLLSLVVLWPAALKMRSPADPYGLRSFGGVSPQRLMAADVLLLLFLALQVVLTFPHESMTASARRVFLMVLETLLPYFVISRLCRSREMIVEAMAAFTLSACVLAPLALVEAVQGWILYAGLEERWGAPHMIGYLKRGDYLRAQVTGGHSIVLGYAMAVAFGCWLYLQTRVHETKWRWLGFVGLVVGLAATFSRGPWVGAVAVLLLFLGLGPNAGSRTMKAVGVLAVLAAIAAVTPLGSRIVEHLPFVGTVDEGSVEYRQRLAEMSWMVVLQNPLFGEPHFVQYMEELRQGEGIVDLVNAYAAFALSYGLVGLSLFVGFFLAVAVGCWRAVRRCAAIDFDFSMVGAALLACIGGALVMIATTSNYLSIPYVYWSLAALACAYARVAQQEQGASTEPYPAMSAPPWGAARPSAWATPAPAQGWRAGAGDSSHSST